MTKLVLLRHCFQILNQISTIVMLLSSRLDLTLVRKALVVVPTGGRTVVTFSKGSENQCGNKQTDYTFLRVCRVSAIQSTDPGPLETQTWDEISFSWFHNLRCQAAKEPLAYEQIWYADELLLAQG